MYRSSMFCIEEVRLVYKMQFKASTLNINYILYLKYRMSIVYINIYNVMMQYTHSDCK